LRVHIESLTDSLLDPVGWGHPCQFLNLELLIAKHAQGLLYSLMSGEKFMTLTKPKTT
jgi:hypothetical protein